MRAAARGVVVAAYSAVFCLLLPLALWSLGKGLDRAWGLQGQPRPVGAVVAVFGMGLLFSGMAALWRQADGLPVSALPPPLLATHGPYRLVRHPIYLGFNLALLGAGLGLGSPMVALIVAPAFFPIWVGYALLEERGLRRRFGHAYRRYQEQVGLTPRLELYGLSRRIAQALPAQIMGSAQVPAEGGVILVANHSCYLDPGYLGRVTDRRVRFLATAQVFRSRPLRVFFEGNAAVPVRRYRPDFKACREMVRLLEEGEVVGLFPEGERATYGRYLGAQPQVARILARLRYPVIPVGISGGYDCGPRWARGLRRRPVVVRVGPPIQWADRDATAAVDDAVLSLLGHNPQPIHLDDARRSLLQRVLWRCPRCLDERAWCPAALECVACGASYTPSPDGWLEGNDGQTHSLAELGDRQPLAPEPGPLTCAAQGLYEPQPWGTPRPLRSLGYGTLSVGSEGVHFGTLRLRLEAIRSISTEGAQTLQVATREQMWQFQLGTHSAFRAQAALCRWVQPPPEDAVGRNP